jgi:hypothetical protein
VPDAVVPDAVVTVRRYATGPLDGESIAHSRCCGSWPGPARSRGQRAQATARYELDLPVSEALS